MPLHTRPTPRWTAGDATPGPAHPPGIVRERSAGYATEDGGDGGSGDRGGKASGGEGSSGSDVAATARGAFAALDAGLGEVESIELAGLGQDELRSMLRRVQRRINRLTSVRALAAAEFEARVVAAAPRGRENAAQKGARQGLGEELNLSPNEAKRSAETGKRLRDAAAAADDSSDAGPDGGPDGGSGDSSDAGPDAGADAGPDAGSGAGSGGGATRAAFERGDVSEGQAAVITDALQQLAEQLRGPVERKLLDAARTDNPVALGRLARRLVAEADPDAARDDERKRHRRRYASVSQTDDGGVRLSGYLAGVQGEKLLTAFHAFRRPDAAEESRTPGQRGADALEAMADAALNTGQAPTQHGQRPHVLVIVEWSTLARQAGIAELGFTGPVTFAEIRPLLADASFSRVVLDADSVPIEVGKQVRTVPAGLWRALIARDRGCSWDRCDTPPAWCQVAHGNLAYADGGRLTPDNAALLCARHHRRFDAGGWRMTIHKGTVVYKREEPRQPPPRGGPTGPDDGPPPGRGGSPPGRGGGPPDGDGSGSRCGRSGRPPDRADDGSRRSRNGRPPNRADGADPPPSTSHPAGGPQARGADPPP